MEVQREGKYSLKEHIRGRVLSILKKQMKEGNVTTIGIPPQTDMFIKGNSLYCSSTHLSHNKNRAT
jgi:hypothetical protein